MLDFILAWTSRLVREHAWLRSTTLGRRFYLRRFFGCYGCTSRAVQLITYDEDWDGLSAPMYCRACADDLLGDDEMGDALAEVGVTWVVIPEPVSEPECIETLMYALHQHRLPFFGSCAPAATV